MREYKDDDNLDNEKKINDGLLKLEFNGVCKWIIYWSIVNLFYIIFYNKFGLFLFFSTFYSFICCCLIIISFKTNNITFYKISFICYFIYAIIIIVYDFFTFLTMLINKKFYKKIIAPFLKIEYFNHVFISTFFITIIITQIIFIEFLLNKFQYFNSYKDEDLEKALFEPSERVI